MRMSSKSSKVNNTKKNQLQQKQNFNLMGNSPGLIHLASNPGIGAWYSGLCGERCCPSCWMACGGDDWRVFFHFPWPYGPSIISGSSEVVSPDDCLVSTIWFLLPTGQVAIET
jgi:hypothetical protein